MIQNYEIHMLQLRQVQQGELLLRGMLLQATDNGRPEDLSVFQGEKAMTPFRTPFKAWLDMLAANPPMQDSTELGLALDFATDVIRTFKRL